MTILNLTAGVELHQLCDGGKAECKSSYVFIMAHKIEGKNQALGHLVIF